MSIQKVKKTAEINFVNLNCEYQTNATQGCRLWKPLVPRCAVKKDPVFSHFFDFFDDSTDLPLTSPQKYTIMVIIGGMTGMYPIIRRKGRRDLAHHLLLHYKEESFYYIKAREPIMNQVIEYGADILRSPGFQSEQGFMQHGITNCYTHSICVAYVALRWAQLLNLHIDVRSTVRGCLLHDYFLYDWHDKDAAVHHHTFNHPKVSLANAERDFALNPIERDIIRKHMFPLCFPFPKYKESWLITIADKTCAASEIWHLWSLEHVISALDSRIRMLLDH